MRKRNLLLLVSLFSLSSIAGVGCDNNTNTPTTDDYDDMFEEPTPTVEEETISLEGYKEENYVFDENSSNENGSVCYEIFVRSFYDYDGDGIGDFLGVKEKLPYLKDLGVKTLWLMPIHQSPSYHGYDVVDYYGVNPEYGTMEDFEALVSQAAEYNIDIMIDIVFNHSSTQSPWFQKSYKDFTSKNTSETSMADWYCWSETSKGGYRMYNGNSKAYYECRFDASMPDFNTENPKVREEFVNILKHWIDKGVKGFRFDAVKYYDYENTAYNAEFLSYLANEAKAYNEKVYFVGECWDNINVINNYYKSTFDSFFKFNSSIEGTRDDTILGQVKAINNSNSFASMIENQEKLMKENNPNAYSSYFLANHDTNRASHSFSGHYAKLAASLLLLMPGTPYMYYGEEIELKGKRVTSPDDQSDVRRRLPMIWDRVDKTGECAFPEINRPELNSNNDQVIEGVNQQLSQNFSTLNHYKKVINIRNKYPFIKDSIFTNMTSYINQKYDNVLAYKLSLGDEYIIVIHNFEKQNVELDVSSFASTILDEVSAFKLTPELENGKLRLGRYSTVILK